MLHNALLALSFLLELAMLAALAQWGWRSGARLPWNALLAAGAPLLAALVWGAFVSPRAAVPVSPGTRRLIQSGVFGAATLALLASGHPALAGAFAVLAFGTALLLHVGD